MNCDQSKDHRQLDATSHKSPTSWHEERVHGVGCYPQVRDGHVSEVVIVPPVRHPLTVLISSHVVSAETIQLLVSPLYNYQRFHRFQAVRIYDYITSIAWADVICHINAHPTGSR